MKGKAAKPLNPATETFEARRQRAQQIYARLRKAFPDARLTLNYETPFQLLVAVILAARFRDDRVNAITPKLFARFPDAHSLASASEEEILQYLQGVNMARVKARRLREVARLLVEKYNGEVPASMEALVALPGIGRKTANVVLGNALGVVVGIEVDTHIARVSQRLGLTTHKDPDRIEEVLMRLLPREVWVPFSHVAKELGRRYCRARNPLCDECPVQDLCPQIGV